MAGVHITGTIDYVNTEVANRLANDAANFIGMKAAPIGFVEEISGTYPFFGREEYKLADDDADAIGRRGTAPIYEETGKLDTYRTMLRGERYVVTRLEQQGKLSKLFKVQLAAKIPTLVDRRLRKHELQAATLIQAEANYAAGNQLAAVKTWDDAASTPLPEIENAIDVVEKVTGVAPNTIIFPRRLWKHFRFHASVITAIKGVAGGPLTRRDVTEVFPELTSVYIGKGNYDSAEKGKARVPVRMWNSRHCILLHVADNNSVEMPSAFRTLVYRPEEIGAQYENGMYVRTYENAEIGGGADIGEVNWHYALVKTGKDATEAETGLVIAGFVIINAAPA